MCPISWALYVKRWQLNDFIVLYVEPFNAAKRPGFSVIFSVELSYYCEFLGAI